MANNVTLPASVGTFNVRTDEIAGVDVQAVKLLLGAEDVDGGYVHAGNPLPVTGTLTNVATIGTSVTPGTSATNLGKAADNPAGATDTGVAVLGIRTTTPATIAPANGDYAPLRLDDQGNLRVNVSAGGSQAQIDDSAFTPGSSEIVPMGAFADETSTDSVDEGDMGVVRMTLDRKQIAAVYAHLAGGWTPYSYVSAGVTEDDTVIKGSAGQLGFLVVTNTNASARYLKLYNKATVPVVASDVPVQRLLIPGNSNGFTINFGPGLEFTTGISFVIVTGVADTDGTEVAANEIIVNAGFR